MATLPATDLRGLRVLVTRPADRAAELLTSLVDAGAQAWHVPLLAIVPLEDGADELRLSRTRLMDLDLYQRVIFISVNAVQCGMALIDQYWPQWPQGVVVYAIGEATAKALADWDLPVRLAHRSNAAPAMNSEALLALPELRDLRQEKVLIVRGLGGRETLAQTLRERGARVDYAECYRRQAPVLEHGELPSLLVKHHINVVCLNSGETLEYFRQHCPPTAGEAEPALLVPSERVARQASLAGYRRVIQAANAGTAATLAALGQMREDHERR